MEYFFSSKKSDFFFSKEQGFWKKMINEIHQKVPFLIYCGKLWQNSRPLCYFTHQNWNKNGVRVDVYACLDCNCWKRITMQLNTLGSKVRSEFHFSEVTSYKIHTLVNSVSYNVCVSSKIVDFRVFDRTFFCLDLDHFDDLQKP